MPSAIPGFDAASSQEQWERHSAHLNIPEEVCGVLIRQITPTDVCKLHVAKSPLIEGGIIDYPHVAQFLYILQFTETPRTIPQMLDHVAGLDLAECCREIHDFLEVTYRDQPAGNPDAPQRDAPIAPSVSWLRYRMKVTFDIAPEETMRTPLRVIYQDIRCWQDEQGVPVINRLSGSIMAKWMDGIQEGLKNGTMILNEYGYPVSVTKEGADA